MKLVVQVTKQEAENMVAEYVSKNNNAPYVSKNNNAPCVAGVEIVQVTIAEEKQNPDQFPKFSLNHPCPIIVLENLKQANIIGAIKEVRQLFGWGLKDAKDYCENLKWNVLKLG